MLQLPPGFDIAALIQDYLSWSTLFITCASMLAGYYVYRKVVNHI